MDKKIQLEQKFKAPKHLKKNIQNTLDDYRLVGEVAGLYVDGILQTLIDFTNLIDPEFTENQIKSPDNNLE
ncbi:MAG: hypothetical protein GY810_32520 [Aureispira sp.]|nr:hypothetical protein [Aureispira sp.]